MSKAELVTLVVKTHRTQTACIARTVQEELVETFCGKISTYDGQYTVHHEFESSLAAGDLPWDVHEVCLVRYRNDDG